MISALLNAGSQHNLSSDRAVQRATELGYHLEDNGHTDVIQLFRDILYG